jgi:phospholipid transport system substrate-binding protein
MRFRHLLVLSSILTSLAISVPSSAVAEDPQSFVQQQHHHIEDLLHQPESSSRDTQVHESLSKFVDYDELTHRAFGEPCPAAEPACEDLWTKYDDDKKAELRGLLEQLVRKTYQRNLLKTLDYDVTYKGARDVSGDTKVLTEAKNRTKPREPAVRVDYVVKQTGSGPKVVDIITEGSSLTKNYYDQFRKKMNNPAEGYPNIVQKLKDKIAKKDPKD